MTFPCCQRKVKNTVMKITRMCCRRPSLIPRQQKLQSNTWWKQNYWCGVCMYGTSCFLWMLFQIAPRVATLLRQHKTTDGLGKDMFSRACRALGEVSRHQGGALLQGFANHSSLSPSGGRQGRHKHFHTHMFQRVLQWSIMQPAALFKISRAGQFVKGLFTFVKSFIISICCSHKELLLALCVFLSLFGCLVHVCSVGRLKYRHLVATYLASP